MMPRDNFRFQFESDIPLDEAPPLQRSEEGAKVEISARSVSGSIEIERALEQVA